MWRVCIVIALLASSARADTLRIGTITVNLTPLFSAAEGGTAGLYRIADRIQVRTREALIRRFLLFDEGDEFDEAKLRESERNLRQLDFLEFVSIKASPPHDGVVDVIVETHDAFTTDINADFSNDGGRALYDFEVTQKNLFNRGGDIDLRVANGLYRRTTSLEVVDPEMFGPYWTAHALAAISSDGNEQRLSVERPLYSYATKLTALASIDHLLQDARTYRSSVIDSIFRQSHGEAAIQAGRVIQTRPAITTRVLAGIDFVDDSFATITGAAPDARHFRWLEVGIDRTCFNFITLDHVDYGLRKQDFNLGAHAAVFGAVSPRGSVSRVRGDASYGRQLGAFSFLITRASATGRIHATNRNAIFSSDTRFIVKLPAKYPETFVAHAHLDVGWNLDRDVQFFADGQNGLRAYPDFAFEGSRRIVLNAEHRVFLGRELLDFFEPGAAAFVDSGEAVTGGFGHPKTDFGVGLRFSIARLEAAMLRFDVAYAVNDSPNRRHGLQFSFATVQAF